MTASQWEQAWLRGAGLDTLPWASLRFSHTTAIRAALARAVSEGRYAPATANKHLAALRGTLKAAWRLGVMETDDYLRAVDLRPIPAVASPPAATSSSRSWPPSWPTAGPTTARPGSATRR